jgi:hypothetical protein
VSRTAGHFHIPQSSPFQDISFGSDTITAAALADLFGVTIRARRFLGALPLGAANVAVGSIASRRPRAAHFRSSPISRHSQGHSACVKGANKRHRKLDLIRRRSGCVSQTHRLLSHRAQKFMACRSPPDQRIVVKATRTPRKVRWPVERKSVIQSSFATPSSRLYQPDPAPGSRLRFNGANISRSRHGSR